MVIYELTLSSSGLLVGFELEMFFVDIIQRERVSREISPVGTSHVGSRFGRGLPVPTRSRASS